MPRDFLALFVGALKKNSILKILKLGGNRLGNLLCVGGLCLGIGMYWLVMGSVLVRCLKKMKP